MSIPDPIVLLDARAKYVHPAFQMTRASTKTVFDSTGKLVTVPANALGWDHGPATGQARGYLAEPSATNLLLHSNGLSESAWAKTGATITPNATTGPDSNGMAKLVEDNQSGEHRIEQSYSITAGDNYTVSVIARAGERQQAAIRVFDSSSISNQAFIRFNVAGGVVESESAGGDGTLVDSGVLDLGGGFYRFYIAFSLASATECKVRVHLYEGVNQSYQGDGTSGLYLGYGQAEEGSYPTSYIETGAATATRAGDSLVLSDLGDFPWWRNERGTLLVDVEPPSNSYDAARFLYDINNEVRLSMSVNGLLHVGGSHLTDNINIRNVVNNPLERSVVCVAWDQDEVACSMNGDIVGTVAAAGSALSAASLTLANSTVANRPLGGHINRAVYYPARLSNADLQSLTAIQE